MPRITSKGQVTIPTKIRKKFNLLPGSLVEFLVERNQVLLVKSRPENKFMKWLGRGKNRQKSSIDRTIDQLRGRTSE